jgi:NAD+ kinase
VGLIVLPRRPKAAALAHQARAQILQMGGDVWEAPRWDTPAVEGWLPGTDLVICFGGDGTIIHGARRCARLGVPIVGVNFGKMGFLTEFEPDEFLPGLPRLLSGDFWIEERTTLGVEHRRNGQLLGRHLAINEALVARGRINRVVTLHTWVDGQYMTSYAADGLLIATPTGSTGSNLAADGPVLPPDMRALVMVPVMPFVSFRNALVLSPASRVDVQVQIAPPPFHEAVLSVDSGTTVPVENGDRVSFGVAEPRCRFARVRPKNYFHAVLVSKLQRAPILPPLPQDTPPPAQP